MIIKVSSAVVRHGICRRVPQPSSGSTPHDRVTDLLIVLTASRWARAEHVQISASHRNSSDNLCGATPGAAHLSAACPQATYWLGLNPIPCPRHSNPHDACGTPCVSPGRFSFLKAFGRRPSEPSGTLTRWAGIRKPSHKRKSEPSIRRFRSPGHFMPQLGGFALPIGIRKLLSGATYDAPRPRV
jgi:hypothetical protein